MRRQRRHDHPAAHVAIGYVRVSTQEQADSGLGLTAAQAKVEAYCAQHELQLRHVYKDVFTGKKTLGREGLALALAEMKAGNAGIFVSPRTDRVARSVSDFHNKVLDAAEEQGWAVVLLDVGMDTRTITGKAMAQMAAVFAEMAGAQISENTKVAMDVIPRDTTHMDRKGNIKRPPGRPRQISNEVHRMIIRLRTKKFMSLGDIAARLDEDGFRPPGGGNAWSKSTIQKVVEGHRLRIARSQAGKTAAEPAPAIAQAS